MKPLWQRALENRRSGNSREARRARGLEQMRRRMKDPVARRRMILMGREVLIRKEL